MGSVTDIAQAVVDVLLTHADVEYGSVSDFAPAVQAQKSPCWLSHLARVRRANRRQWTQTMVTLTHRLRIEFWCKHTQGKTADTSQRARDIATEAIALLMVNDGEGYEPSTGPFEETIDPALVQFNQASWLVSTLTVPVRNVIAVEIDMPVKARHTAAHGAATAQGMRMTSAAYRIRWKRRWPLTV